jgi:hypothetical protein
MKKGLDTSLWDGVINWKLASTKFDFVFMKCFEYTKDPQFEINWNNSRGLLARGAYYFWRQSSDAVDTQRTNDLLKVLANYDGELPVVIDLEDNKAVPSLVFGQIDRLSERIKQATGRYPIIYTGLNYWSTTCASKASQYWCDVHPLWISLPNIDYHTNFEIEYREVMNGTRLPFIPKVPPFKKVDFIQWTYRGKPEDVPGYPVGKKAIDFNLYLGTDTEWGTICKGVIPPVQELTDKQKLDILWSKYGTQ